MSVSQAPQSDESVSLYAAHEKVYPREVRGRFASLRNLATVILLGIFYITPLISINGQQMLLFDLPARKFHIFGLTLWPQDFIYLASMLILAGLSLFFFTALVGRVWCGYACPQTVWTEAFVWMERRIEGTRSQQMKRDKGAKNAAYYRTKFIKHSVWILFSLWTGFTFVGYFTPIHDLANNLVTFQLGGWETFWILFYGFATYGNAGFMREQVCMYMCPYARFQSAMFDADTMIVAYDDQRGEPRGARKRGTDGSEKGLGACIDCNICVQVCPTGIDIRDGLQYQCIACSACIDACDDVMDKMQYPRGLIKYTTENITQGKGKHVIRLRVIIYAAILATLMGALITSIVQRVPVDLDVIRDRSSLYRETNEGLIENVYTLKILNMHSEPHEFTITAEGIEGMQLLLDDPSVVVGAGAIRSIIARIQADEANLEGRSTEINFRLQAAELNHLSTVKDARFLGPSNY